jgi:hypothetical protein
MLRWDWLSVVSQFETKIARDSICLSTWTHILQSWMKSLPLQRLARVLVCVPFGSASVPETFAPIAHPEGVRAAPLHQAKESMPQGRARRDVRLAYVLLIRSPVEVPKRVVPTDGQRLTHATLRERERRRRPAETRQHSIARLLLQGRCKRRVARVLTVAAS